MRTAHSFSGVLPESSFLSCEKDTELIIKKLFVDSKPYSDILKRLLVINNKDCLDNNIKYEDIVRQTSLKELIDKQYIRLQPRLDFGENQELKSYVLLSFDNFSPNATNDYYRDNIIEIDIICNLEAWDLGNYRQRPLKIAGYIDAILNKNKLTGIGTLDFISCNQVVLSENLAGYCLMYRAIHSDDDSIPAED